MTPIKARKLSTDRQALGGRIHAIREALGPWEGKSLPYKELAKVLERPLSTVKRWELFGRISASDAVLLAQVADCAVDWILTGRGEPPARRSIDARRRLTAGPDSSGQVRRAGRVTSGGSPGGISDAAALPEIPTKLSSFAVPVSQQGAIKLVASAIAAAVERAIERDELEHTDKRRRLLGELFTDLGVILEKNGVRATELLDVAMSLRKGKKGAKGSS